MPADPHDLGSDHELILKFQRTRRNGTTGSLTTLVGGEAIYADTINIAKAADRARFVSDLMAKCPSIDRDDAEQQLLIIVARLACETDGTDDRDESATDEGASYDVVDGRLCRVIGKGSEGGDRISIPLCNFASKIVEVVVRDDGVEQSCRLAIEGTLATGEPLPRIEISPEEFARSDWPLTRWETCATVYVGPYFRDHLRAALQLYSGRLPRRAVFTCTGWQQIGGMWAFLHDLGAIGPFGPMQRISVDLPDALENFRFPNPP